jgi:heme/copper-type cytochrome/quinol oxidase subunit 1
MTETIKSENSFWKSPKRILGTTNAQELGKLYFVLALINASIAGLYAVYIRLELWTYDGGNIYKTATDYNAAFTIHGTAMIFLVIVPFGAGFGNYLIPRMVAADNNDMYWPKWNNIAFWMLPMGSLLIFFSQAPIGWTAYPPLSVFMPGVDMWISGLVLAGTSSTIGALNFILTIWKGRAPYVKWRKLDLFVWGTLLTSILIIIATPVLTVALTMVLFDRNFGTVFFDGSLSDPIIYQHIFWFYSHPAVYIMVLPSFGLVSGLIAKFARKEIFGYDSMIVAMSGIAVLSVAVWVHHMYATGIDPFIRIAFTTMTFVIAIPSGIKVFNWLTTLYGGRIKLEVPMLFALSFILFFTLGGITGVYVNLISLDINLHDTYWIVGHFHFVVAAGVFQVLFGAVYYYYPELTGGKMYDKLHAKIHFWLWIIGNFVAFLSFQILGMEGMPRRYYSYPYQFEFWHRFATVGGLMMATGFLFFITSLVLGSRKKKSVDFDNIFDLGSGYDFPKPFAEHIKETTGEELHVEHELSFWAPAFGFALSMPLLSVMAFLEQGPFGRGRLLEFLGGPITGYLFILLFIGFIAAFYVKDPTGKRSMVDKYRVERNYEIWVFLASEVIFFTALIGTFIALKANSTVFPDPSEVLNVLGTAFNTFVLIVSSFTMAKSVESIKNGNTENLKKYLIYTILLGVFFISFQAFEYMQLANENLVSLSGVAKFPLFSSSFYLMTGFHGAHVLAGIIFLTFLYIRARKGAYTEDNHEYVEMVGLYWHFVDVVWILLFTIVYLM